MNFVRVVFRRFGPFENQTLDLSGPGGLHVVFGPNEAGKSSALRGLHALLFGFPTQNADHFRFKYAEFRVEASIEDASGNTLACVRRKGNKDTLRATDDKTVIPEARLTQILGSLQQQQFELLFGLDSKRLNEGGLDIAQGRGNLGEALFVAGTGVAGLRNLARTLDERRLKLYTVRGQNQPINKALAELDAQTDAVRERILPPDTYAAADTDAHTAREKVESLRRERNHVRSQLSSLQRYQSALPTIELLERARRRLEPVSDAPRLGAGFETELSAARQEREVALAKLSDLEAERNTLEQQLRQAPLNEKLLAEETEIDELKKLVGADARQQREATKADIRRSEEEAKARDIFRELTGTTEWEQMAGLKPRLEDEWRITELANERAAVWQAVANCESKVRQASEALTIAESKQRAGAAPTDLAPWLAAVESISALGPVESQAQVHQRETAAEELRLTDEFARFLPSVPGAWSEAASVQVPSPETVARFREEFEAGLRAIEMATGERDRIDRDMAALREQLVDIVGAEPVPTVEELSRLRRDRDDGLHLIRRRLVDDADLASESTFTARHAPGRPLIDAAEAAVRQCDALADRLRHEAERVARWHALQLKLTLLQDRSIKADHEHVVAKDALARIEQAWQAAWEPAGIAPDTPQVMQAWLARWQRFAEKVAAWNSMRLKCQEEERQIAALRSQLADACPFTRAACNLAEGLALARQASNDARSIESAAQKINDEIIRLKAELATARASEAHARERQKHWTQEWSCAIATLKLGDPGISVRTVQDYLKRVGEMQHHLSDMRINAARVKEIALDRHNLLGRIIALRKRLDPAARPTTAETLDADCRDLDVALSAARDSRIQRKEQENQLSNAKADTISVTSSLREADARLHVLAAQAGVKDLDSIAPALQRANQRLLAEGQIQEQEKALATNSRGQPLDEFVAAALKERDQLDPKIGELEHRTQQLDPEITDAEAEAFRTAQTLEAFQNASDAAAQARQKAELIGVRLEQLVIEYAALHLAHIALARAKERYRARHQGSMLNRAGEFFKTLTDQAFLGLDIENEEGTDVLMAVRPAQHPNPRVRVDELSDGTRDQLFLALRLAGIEQHLRDREPVPLIVDDVLVSFDDTRARATLRCLGELSAKTQVLLFTHHRHIVNLAREVNPATPVHELLAR